ncbi:hypothetical protein F5B20DRAFT_595795 [Whalleya microplaca]|nr:hypothetical protein F5B20DRAFT_595795 [Whalleya microplaca]
MVKVVNTLAEKLAKANQIIATLQQENAMLAQENRKLRSKKVASKCSNCSVTDQDRTADRRGDRRYTLGEGCEKRNRARYQQPTIASRNRAAKFNNQTSQSQTTGQTEVIIGCGIYVYKDATPIHIGALSSSENHVPSFMMPTSSSWRRSCGISRGWGTWKCDGGRETAPAAPQQQEEPEYSFAPECRQPEQSLAIRSRLDDSLVYHADKNTLICSSSGFRFLKEAYKTIQRVVFETAKASWPDVWKSHYEGGPHLVRLGRDELHRCIGECGNYPKLAINGYSTADIRYALLDVVDLRNSVCHPEQSSLQHPNSIDRLLRSAQDIPVKLGNEAGSMTIRVLRDNLRDEVAKSLQDIKDYHMLAVLPGATRMGLEWEPHHRVMFQQALEQSERGNKEGYCEETLVVAMSWEDESEVLRPVNTGQVYDDVW